VAGHVFVSYSREDQAYVDRLVALLRERGAEVWLDHLIDYGQHWATVIEERVETCALILVVMTPRSKTSPWVEREIYAAERANRTIMPLLLEGRIWFQLSNYQAEIVQGGTMPSDRFVAAVVAAAPAQAPAASAPPIVPTGPDDLPADGKDGEGATAPATSRRLRYDEPVSASAEETSAKTVSFRLAFGSRSQLIEYRVTWWDDALAVDGAPIEKLRRESKDLGGFWWHGYAFTVSFAGSELHCVIAIKGYLNITGAALLVDGVVLAEAGQPMPETTRIKAQSL
jgi:hypothetical protein